MCYCCMQVGQVRHRPTPAEPWVIVDFADPRAGQMVLQVRSAHLCQLPTDRQQEQYTFDGLAQDFVRLQPSTCFECT